MNQDEHRQSARSLLRSDFPADARFWLYDSEIPMVQSGAD